MPPIVPMMAPKAASGIAGFPRYRRRFRAALNSLTPAFCLAIAGPLSGAAAARRRSRLVSAIASAVVRTRVDLNDERIDVSQELKLKELRRLRHLRQRYR